MPVEHRGPHRQRPPMSDWLTSAGGWSYPSGHTMQATAACGILLVLFGFGKSSRVKVVLASAATLLVLLVAASRVYLGVHWLSDVLGSISLTVALLSVWGITRLAGSPDDSGRDRTRQARRGESGPGPLSSHRA